MDQLTAAYGVTAANYATGSVGGLFKTTTDLVSHHNQTATNGDPAIFAFTGANGPLLLVCQYGQASANNMLVIDPSGASWSVTVVAMTPMTNIYSVVENATHIFCIDYDTATVGMFSKNGYTLTATYQQQATEVGYQVNGVALARFNNYVVALFTESLNPWTTGSYTFSRVVLLDPTAVVSQSLPPVSLILNGTSVTSVPVGNNANGLAMMKDTGTTFETWYAFVTCLGGVQNTGFGNGALSRLDSVKIEFDTEDEQILATVTTHIMGTDSSSLDFRRLSFKADGSVALLLIGNVYNYDSVTYKTYMTWQLYESSFSVIKLLVNQTISLLQWTPVLQNDIKQGYDIGYLWDVHYDNINGWAVLAHGDSIYVYDRTAANPWAAPIYVFNQTDANPNRELNNDANGNLNSYCVLGSGVTLMGSVPQPVASRQMTMKEFVIGELKKKNQG
jgi:hypothetical protein